MREEGRGKGEGRWFGWVCGLGGWEGGKVGNGWLGVVKVGDGVLQSYIVL